MKLFKLHLPPRCCSRDASREWDAALGKGMAALGKGMASQLPSSPLTPHSPTDLCNCLKPIRATTQPRLPQTP